MTLPEDFNSIEHFQDTLRRLHNRQVRDYFRDVGDDNWDPDISTPRGSLRVACTMDDNDTLTQCLYRYQFFHITVRRGEEFTVPVYGIPTGVYQETRKFRPQIFLWFQEDSDETDLDYHPIRARITCRLMDETTESLTDAKLQTLANKIKAEFTPANGYKWRKGRVLCRYTDNDKGYSLQIYAVDKTEGKQVISKVLDIQNHTPDWEKLTVNENEEPLSAYPTIPPNKIILGETYRQPRKRPVGNVRFQYALLHVYGIEKPICLVDRAYRFLNAIERG